MIQNYLHQIDQPIYDTAHTLAPRRRNQSDRQVMFTIPFGQCHETKRGLRVKTFEDTNMLQAGCLDHPKSMEVRSIRCALIGRRLFPAESRYYRDLFLEFEVCGKSMWKSPGWRCADPSTLLIEPKSWLLLEPDERQAITECLSKKLDPAILLEPGYPFSMRVTYGEAWFDAWYAAPEKLVVLLEGKLSVAVL